MHKVVNRKARGLIYFTPCLFFCVRQDPKLFFRGTARSWDPAREKITFSYGANDKNTARQEELHF